MKLQEIVEMTGGTLKGDGGLEITGASGLGFAKSGDISYVGEAKFLPDLKASSASAVFIQKETETDKAQIIHPAPALAFAKVLAHLHPTEHPPAGVHPSATIADSASLGVDVTISANACVEDGVQIGDRCVVHANAVIGKNCVIGSGTVLYPNVTVYADTHIGSHVVIHAGSVIGADGFSYTPDEKGRHVKLQQIGRVVIRDHVEIGANTCIDRAAFGETVIGEGVKIDNLVQIGHNCVIGDHSVIVSQTGISGSCEVGRHTVIAGQTGISDHVKIADQVTLLARSGVFRDITEPGIYGFAPAMKGVDLMRFMPVLLRLPEMASQIKDLERKLESIEKA